MALLRTSGRRSSSRHAAALQHLSKVDPVLAQVMMAAGPCLLAPRRDHFATLCDSIISQQLSPAAAATIYSRFARLFPDRRPTPQAVVRLRSSHMLRAGVSRQKARYLRELATAFLTKAIRPGAFRFQRNEEIIARLTAVHGVGRCTAEMFLIFSLNRPDVLPLRDLAIRKAVQRCYGLRSPPSTGRLLSIAKRWHPYETIACWYLWHSLRPRERPPTVS